MTTTPDDDDGGTRSGDESSRWTSEPSDADVDAAFASIVSGLRTDPGWSSVPISNELNSHGPVPPPDPDPAASASRHPSAGARRPDTASDRARRRELRRIERAEEVAAFAAHQAEVEAERAADQEHFTPPDPPPLPRPRGRTIGALLILLCGVALLVRPGILAVGPDLALILALVLTLGGSTMLLTGIWRRRQREDSDGDDGAIV